jgi:hypothetical protein
MLFHFTHVHTPESCPAHKPEALKALAAWMQSAEEKGIHIHSLHVAPWEHTYYGILEANDAASLVQFIDPMLELGIGKITPVTDILAEIKRRLATT